MTLSNVPFDATMRSDRTRTLISTESALSMGASLHGHQLRAPKGSLSVHIMGLPACEEVSRARWLGGLILQVGNDPEFTVSEAEAEVVEAAISFGRVFSGPELCDKSGVPSADKVLRILREKYPCLESFIGLSGKEKKGYWVDIVDARASKD